MNVPIRMLGIATTIFWIILVGFIVSAAYSIKDLNFSVGEPQFTATSSNDLLFSLPLYVDNRGYYSLKAFNLTTVFMDPEGAEISRASTFVPVIPQGGNTTILHNVTISRDSFAGNEERYLFNDTDLTVAVTAGLNFAEFLPTQLSTNISYPWGAPFYDFALGQPQPIGFTSSNAEVMVPLSFENHAAFDLIGSIRVQLYDSANSLLGESQTPLNVTKYSSYSGNLNFDISPSAARSADRSGRFEVYFSTPMFEYGPVVIPYG
jgi:hypothetical protein